MGGTVIGKREIEFAVQEVQAIPRRQSRFNGRVSSGVIYLVCPLATGSQKPHRSPGSKQQFHRAKKQVYTFAQMQDQGEGL
jgi:hypothetical protein